MASKNNGKRITREMHRDGQLEKLDAIFDMGIKANHNQRRVGDAICRKLYNMTMAEMRREMITDACSDGPHPGCAEFGGEYGSPQDWEEDPNLSKSANKMWF